MSFRDNLQHLRGTRDLSQAQLATLLGVSRQSVAKWEAEKSYPEMDKLIKLCDLFECSLDDLVRGDLTGCATANEAIVEAEPASAATPVDKDGYDEHMRRRAWDVAAGVAVIVMSFGVAMFVTGGGYNSTTVSANIVVHLVGIALGLCFFVPAYRSHAAFRKEYPVVEDCYTPEEKAEAVRRRRRCRAARLGHVHARHAPIDSDVLVRAVGAVRLLRRRGRSARPLRHDGSPRRRVLLQRRPRFHDPIPPSRASY